MTKTAVITGASAGIGRELARALATHGWRVIGTGRDLQRIAQAEAEIRAASTTGEVDFIVADFSLMASVEALAQRIGALTDRIDVLANNAGGLANEKQLTAEGLEANFAGNHLGAFLLTQRLLPILRATAKNKPTGSVRILNTSSMASEMIEGIDFDDLQGLRDFNAGRAYSTSKLANVLFTRALAERLAGDGIVAHAIHPGTVESNFYDKASPHVLDLLRKYEIFTPAQGADTLLWLATAAEGGESSGGYWEKRAPRLPHALANDEAARDRLWAESERLVVSAGSKWPD